MHEALERLGDEHRHILRVLSTVEEVTARCRREGRADPTFFFELADFLARFADDAHHLKEEEGLFRALREAGLPAEGGPIACMLHEHTLGRELRSQIESAAILYAGGELGVLDCLLDSSLRYGALLRAHIAKEDGFLYPMAERLMTAETLDTLLARYAQLCDVEATDFARAADRLVKKGNGAQPGTPAEVLETTRRSFAG